MSIRMGFKPRLVLGSKTDEFPVALRLFSAGSDKRAIYRLRYRAYRQAGWIAPREDEQLADAVDRLPSTLNIAAMRKDQCVGALRLAMDRDGAGAAAMPSGSVFPDAIAGLRRKGHRRLVEFSRMALEPSLPNTSFRTTVLVSLVRAGLILCHASDVDYAVVAVHKKFAPFHRAMFGFEFLGESVAYIDIDEPTHLLGRTFGGLDMRRKGRSAFFDITDEEIREARRAVARMGLDVDRASA